MVNETDPRCSSCLTCDQSSHLFNLTVPFCKLFSRNAWIFFFSMPRSWCLFLYFHCFMQIYISLSTTEFKVIGILQKTVTHYGTLFEGTNQSCIKCGKHALNINQHKKHRVHTKCDLFVRNGAYLIFWGFYSSMQITAKIEFSCLMIKRFII